MSGEILATPPSRAESGLRKAFEAAGDPVRKQVGLTVWATVSAGTALSKHDRCAKSDGDLNPTWAWLETVLALNPGPILDYIAERCSVRIERVAPDPAKSLEQIVRLLHDQNIKWNAIGRLVEQLSSQDPEEVQPPRASVVPPLRKAG